MRAIDWIKKNYWLVIICIVAIIARFYHINHQSLWVDEIISAKLSHGDLPFSEVLSNFKKTAHPPIYFILLHTVMLLFGSTALTMKVFSAITGVLGVLVLYYLGKELISKKVGLLAAALLSLNYFHIYYSQEARMYSLFFLFSALSLYFLVKLIKKPAVKWSILYGTFAALMIHTHYFGLFTLVAQVALLGYFALLPYNIKRVKFIKYSIIPGAIVLISYLPVLKTLKGHAKTSSVWIPKPHSETLGNILQSFFGNSEVVIVFAILLIMLFFVRVSKIENHKGWKLDPVQHKWEFTTIVLLTVLILGLGLPLFRSYTKVSIMIDRYFFNILPALILLIAMGLSSIKSHMIKSGVLITFLLFSWVDICFQKWHYKGVFKTQFREVSEYISKDNKENINVASSLGFYYDFYLKQKDVKIATRNLEDQIKIVTTTSNKPQSFWYADAHNRPYSLSKGNEEKLLEFYQMSDSVELFDAWAKKYTLKENAEE